MKKGFTLIELLAVILILGIIALIAIPVVNNIIKEAKKGAFKTTVENAINAAETKCQLQQVKGETITTSYDFSDSDINTKMNVKGKLPTSGTLILNNECSVTAVNASDGTFTATLNNGKVEIANGGGTNNSNKICTLKSGEALAIGSEYECDPGDGKKRTFYVLEDGDAAIKTDATPAGSISLIMDRNIDNTTVAWSADGKSHKDEDESAQAITVKAQMNANTIGWTKVLVDLPTGQQIANAGGLTTWTDDGTSTSNVPGLSTWLYCNLSENSAPYGYWTKTPHTRYTGGAWYVADGMNVSSVEGHVNFSSRPVITISKSDL